MFFILELCKFNCLDFCVIKIINIANILTLSRVLALFLIVCFLHLDVWGMATASFIFFVIAALSDVLDGYLARKFKQVSTFGKFMDALTDKILVIGLTVALLVKNIIPSWGLFCVLLIICREFLVTGLRLISAGKGKILAAERAGKQKTFLQLYFIGNFLFFSMIDKDWQFFCTQSFINFSYNVACLAFVGATLLTIYSGYLYLSKYWDIFIED